MKIVFKKTKIDDKIINEPLFAWNDDHYDNVSLQTILFNMNKLVDENTLFFSKHVYNCKFKDCPPSGNDNFGRRDINILVRLKDGCIDEILKISDSYSEMSNIENLLNKEVKDISIRYETFRVQGKLV